MKQIIRLSVVVIFSMASLLCRAQQLVQTTDDLNKLIANKDQFIGKPLSNLLAQIKPPIKRINALCGEGVSSSFIFLSFMSDSEYVSCKNKTGKVPTRTTITIQVAEEHFDWNPAKRAKGHLHDWTKEDAEKLGNLTVVDIRVFVGSN